MGKNSKVDQNLSCSSPDLVAAVTKEKKYAINSVGHFLYGRDNKVKLSAVITVSQDRKASERMAELTIIGGKQMSIFGGQSLLDQKRWAYYRVYYTDKGEVHFQVHEQQ